MNLQVRLFARARDLAQTDTLQLEMAEPATVGDLRKRLVERCPALQGLLEHSAFAVNDEFADDNTLLTAKVSIALLPPVSGGAR